MDIGQILKSIGETVGAGVTAKSVFGEPVTSGQRTVLPVAEVRYAFAAGRGGGGRDASAVAEGEPHPRRGGGGGACRGSARPCGLVEVTPEGARFIYFNEPLRLAAVVGVGFLAGFAAGFACRSKPRSKSV